MKAATAFLAAASLALVAGAEDSWQVRHMKHEHGFDNFDALSFFTLHDSDGSKTWARNDILNLYGLLRDEVVGDGSGVTGATDGGSTTKITEEMRQMVLDKVLSMIDSNGDGIISLEEWRVFNERGGELPDFGLGPGHHGDYEHEYEVHHWLEHHAKNDPDVKIVHPEDIEHERLYHQAEHGDDIDTHHDVVGSWEKIENIPSKFRRIR